ncbi:MAG TPA: AsmA-like C-terminal region-containing protein, partial [Steroidobacteraceae bacterium]|nr:AsmA-like C-terminal region-containing protein [Steroidobacteraceae bacterium]
LSLDLAAAELRAGERSFAAVHVLADRGPGVDRLRVESPDLTGEVRWPAAADGAQPVRVRLERLDLAGLDSGAAGAALGALGSAVELTVAQLDWQGRPLGALAATLASRAGSFEIREPAVEGAGDVARGTLACEAPLCHATVSLETHDAGALLARLGLRADLASAHGAVNAELAWPVGAAPTLTALRGTVHLALEDGVARGSAAAAAPGMPPGLLAVPGLIAAMGLPQLPFARLSGDFTLGGGEALTSNLHLDGDTEILVHGRVGLAARDYDAAVWVLKGEERLPAAVRALPPAARMAALWMSLRELFGGGGRAPAAWRLRGTWDDPMVTEP